MISLKQAAVPFFQFLIRRNIVFDSIHIDDDGAAKRFARNGFGLDA